MVDDTSSCPYCGVMLKKRPQRKTKCPHCGRPIYVKRPCGSKPGTKELMTADRVAIEQQKWNKLNEQRRLQEWKRTLISAGVSPTETEREITNTETMYIASELLLQKVIREQPIHEKVMAAGVMIRVALNTGRDPMPWKETSYRFELEKIRLSMQQAPDFVIAARTSKYKLDDRYLTDHCDARIGLTMSVDEALEKMPLPCGINCVCHYQPVFATDRDLNMEDDRVEDKKDSQAVSPQEALLNLVVSAALLVGIVVGIVWFLG